MSICDFETMVTKYRADFRNALKNDTTIEQSKNVARIALNNCCSEFEEQTIVENLREVLVDEYGLA